MATRFKGILGSGAIIMLGIVLGLLVAFAAHAAEPETSPAPNAEPEFEIDLDANAEWDYAIERREGSVSILLCWT
jgi:hypothetical protein